MRRSLALALAGTLTLALGACSSDGGSTAADGSTQVRYWMWDSNQVPAYQKCADAFTAANPATTVVIEQFGWDDYWTKLTASFVGGSGPDVFVDHLSKYGEFAQQGQIEPLDERIAADGVDLSVYSDGLAEPWVHADGQTYGLPKDWDTTGFFYNTEMLEEAGLTPEDLWEATWNPQDGGTFEDAVARLTVDSAGVRGDEAGFDPQDVAVYGLGLNPNYEETGQMQWSNFTGTTGWDYLDENPWGTQYAFDAPEFQDTISWFYGLSDKGFSPRSGVFTDESLTQVGSAQVAMGINGSWATGSFLDLDGVEVGVAPGPVGPDGVRGSIFNGVADSISISSKNKDEAWEWVKFLGTTQCQDLVAESAVVFPSIPSSADKALAAFESEGADVSAFFEYTQGGNRTFLPPITLSAGEVNALVKPALEDIAMGNSPASSMTSVNEQVNALLAP